MGFYGDRKKVAFIVGMKIDFYIEIDGRELKKHPQRHVHEGLHSCTRCKGDSPCQWNTAIFRPPGIANPWTDRHQSWWSWPGWCREPQTTRKLYYFYLKGGTCTAILDLSLFSSRLLCNNSCLWLTLWDKLLASWAIESRESIMSLQMSDQLGCNTVCNVVQNCCMGDEPCQWNTPIFRHSGIANPWTDRHQSWWSWPRWCREPQTTRKLCYFALYTREIIIIRVYFCQVV